MLTYNIYISPSIYETDSDRLKHETKGRLQNPLPPKHPALVRTIYVPKLHVPSDLILILISPCTGLLRELVQYTTFYTNRCHAACMHALSSLRPSLCYICLTTRNHFLTLDLFRPGVRAHPGIVRLISLLTSSSLDIWKH